MKSVVALRHLQFEDLGTLEPLLQEQGYQVTYVDATQANLARLDAIGPDLLVILGGPVGAFDDDTYPFIAEEAALVKTRLQSRRPLLGICLGAQLIARVLGATVSPMGYKEIGFAPLSLTTAGLNSPLAALGDIPVLHWHGDQFEIPQGATRLAGTECCPNQAFAYGRNVLGLQFHLEADPSRIEQWLVGHANEIGQVGIDPRQLRAQAQPLKGALERVAREAMSAWLEHTVIDAPEAVL
ncbi:glutamine amidotransferase [Pokkaliibacter sp. MBI-7]|uniref:glutamine amidotransferase n=1 Tax=Pokkaliibacter sp. MBI-7 TaxID=3040600 RepID=UPI002449755B|nr:glutamine amidotransferase [Pokkaliibacter sp. MBI-7]MDH2433959.1 glutamine amidotransferase [Pokkaliibacter sp. MBI-7]